METYWVNFMLVLVCVGVSDVAWTLYIINSNQKKAFAAATWASIIVLLGGYTVLSYTKDNSLIVPALIGGFIGTYLTIKFSK